MPIEAADSSFLTIRRLYTFFHFHFATGYVFPGERHPFWEMVYVRSGEVDIGADDRVYMLNGGDVIFHRPDEYHSIWANYAHAPELLVVSFECDSPAMRAFERRRLRVTPEQQAMFADLLRQAELTFDAPLDSGKWPVRPGRVGGTYALQLALTRLLMDMLQDNADSAAAPSESPRPDAGEELLIESILSVFKENLRGELRFGDLCRRVGMSATAVKQLFRRCFETTPMAYYERLRISEAQRLLRGGRDVAAAAYAMGFASSGYFSTRFKHVTGQTPTEYLRECRRAGVAEEKSPGFR